MAETVLLQEQVARFAPQEGIAFEEARFTAFKSGRATYPELHFWQQSQSIVTTQTMARHATFDWASERSRARGWPVAIRRSGGGTVFHGQKVLCVSLMERLPAANANVDFAYHRLCDLLLAGLRDLGVEASVGPLPAAPCDGRFNILAGGRKLAGTAARMRFDGAGVAVLSHAALIVGGEHAAGVEAVHRFESDLGTGHEYASGCMTSVSQIAGLTDIDQCAAAIQMAFTRSPMEAIQ